MNDLVGSVEAAEILRRPHATVKRWAASGKLKHAAKMPGDTGAYLFDRSVVTELAAEIETERRDRVAKLEAELERAQASVPS